MKITLSHKKIPLIMLTVFCASIVLLFARTAPKKILLANEQPENVSAEDGDVYLPVVMKMKPKPKSVSMELFVADLPSDTITDIANAGDARLFLLQRNGIIYIADQNGTLLPDPFLDISSQVADPGINWELGALGLVFHPNFPSTPYVYISYTSEDNYRIHLDRYTVNPANPNIADPNSRLFMLQISKTGETDPNVPVSPVHNGGDLAFGPDGYLYMGTGDGGPDPHFGSTVPHDPANHGQRTDVLLGKILRIDVNGGGLPPTCDNADTPLDGNYRIPADNPFVGQAGCDEIWSTGLRNPWRMSFDAETGDFYIADVGEWIQEEIDFEAAGSSGGQNYGWRCFEGTYDQTIDHPDYADRCKPASAYDMPVHIYTHAQTGGCSITGGFVYRGSKYPVLDGWYIFSDFCAGQIWLTQQGADGWQTIYVGVQPYISTFGEGTDGELYAAVSGTLTGEKAAVYRITAR